MTSLKIDGTEHTPAVNLDKEKNTFEISGNSYPEDSTAFFKPVIQWISEYGSDPNTCTEFVFGFEYFNSSSYKSIYDIIFILEDFSKKKGVEVKVKWFFKERDLDIRDIGESLAETIKIPFSIISVA